MMYLKNILIVISLLILTGCSKANFSIETFRYSEIPETLYSRNINQLEKSFLKVYDLANQTYQCRTSGTDEIIEVYESYLEINYFLNEALGRSDDKDNKDDKIIIITDIQREATNKAFKNAASIKGYASSHDSKLSDLKNKVTTIVEEEINKKKGERKNFAKMVEPKIMKLYSFSQNRKSEYRIQKFKKAKRDLNQLYVGRINNLQADLEDLYFLVSQLNVVSDQQFKNSIKVLQAVVKNELSFSAFMDPKDERLDKAGKGILQYYLTKLSVRLNNYFENENLTNSQRCGHKQADLEKIFAASKALEGNQATGTARPNLDQAIGNALNLVMQQSNIFIKDGFSEQAIRILAKSNDFWASQIDRLQDATDPVWAEILREENKPFWETSFSQTYYEVEGKSSLVVVRERPGHFKVQKAENDPSVLIKSQLGISRAISGGLIDVVGAFTGTQNFSSKLLKGNDGEQEDEDQMSLRTINARVEEENNIRKTAILNLISNLQNIKDDIKLLPDSTSATPSQVGQSKSDQLKAILEGHKPIFENQQ